MKMIVPPGGGPLKDRRGADAPPDKTGWRKQLVNGQEAGPIERVSLSEAMITSLHGILLDIDPDRMRDDLAPLHVRTTPNLLLEEVVGPLLANHPVFDRAEVRSSGRGLHVIVRMTPGVEFDSEAERERWAGVVGIVQGLLPTDPDCPGITATTRLLNSTNEKNGSKVVRLKKATPVSPDEVLALCQEAVDRPFRTTAGLLFGPAERLTPCPVCRKAGTALAVLDRVGKCYGSCGTVRRGALLDVFLKPRPARDGRAS